MANKGYFWAAPLCLAAGVSLLAGCAHQFELVQPVKKNFQRELSKYRPLVPSEPTCMIGFQYTEDSLVVTVASENARRAGLRPGDLILSVEGQEIVKRADIEENFEKKSAGDEIRLGIMRADHPLHLVAMCQDRQKALQRFKKRGGLITQLPDQVVPPRNRVGGKFAVYESVTDTGESARN